MATAPHHLSVLVQVWLEHHEGSTLLTYHTHAVCDLVVNGFPVKHEREIQEREIHERGRSVHMGHVALLYLVQDKGPFGQSVSSTEGVSHTT
ncbi:hypothetical protein ACMFMG_001811 [Clarireedia jacksonii]